MFTSLLSDTLNLIAIEDREYAANAPESYGYDEFDYLAYAEDCIANATDPSELDKLFADREEVLKQLHQSRIDSERRKGLRFVDTLVYIVNYDLFPPEPCEHGMSAWLCEGPNHYGYDHGLQF